MANAFADNTASCRLMERVGMRRETHAVGESLHRSGEWLDTVGCAVSADEWDGLTSATGPRVGGVFWTHKFDSRAMANR